MCSGTVAADHDVMESYTPVMGFICSAGCPEIVAGFWLIVAGAVSAVVAIVGFVLKVLGAATDSDLLIRSGSRVGRVGGTGFLIAGTLFGILFVVTVAVSIR